MSNTTLTHLLRRLPCGGREAFDELLGQVYQDLRRLAHRQLQNERREHTLSATGLVHEGWMRLAGQRQARFENRAHFFGAVAQTMRRVLVDHARGRAAGKRHADRVGLTAALAVADDGAPVDEVLGVDAALSRLAAINERLVRVIECRYFAGLTIPETAQALGISPATVSEDWRFARAWLRRELAPAAEQEVA